MFFAKNALEIEKINKQLKEKKEELEKLNKSTSLNNEFLKNQEKRKLELLAINEDLEKQSTEKTETIKKNNEVLEKQNKQLILQSECLNYHQRQGYQQFKNKTKNDLGIK